MGKKTPQKSKNFFHISLIKHGREICTSRRPKCSECFLKEECDYFKKQNSKN